MPDEKRIKDFEPATNLLIDDWFAVDSPSQGTRKIQKSMFMADEIASLQTLSTAMGNAQTDIGNLQTRAGMSQSLNFGDNLTDGVNILSVLLGAEPYVNTRTYAVGEYCIYEKQLYKCTTAVTSAEDFDSDKWTLTNVKTELTELNSSLTNYVVRYVTWNNTPASYTNGAYYYNDYITDINKSNYTIVSVWAENTKWKMPCFAVLSDVQNANYILRLQYAKSDFTNVSDLANTNVSLRIGYVRNS